jgi:hypothetical protein
MLSNPAVERDGHKLRLWFLSGAFRKSRKFGGLIVMDFLRRFSSAAFL